MGRADTMAMLPPPPTKPITLKNCCFMSELHCLQSQVVTAIIAQKTFVK